MKRMLALLVAVYFAPLAISAQFLKSPVCPTNDSHLPVNNAQILEWKRTTKNQFQQRGHVEGVIVDIYPNHSGHRHFSVQIGRNEEDTIELIYNEDFGRIRRLEEGMKVRACGDYITATAPKGPYPKSPDNAILHWVHMNPRDSGHLPGYVQIDGKMYGQENAN